MAKVKKLVALRGQNKDLKIYIKGDKNLNYGKIMDLMSMIQLLKIWSVILFII